MNRYFFDTSALVKIYHREQDSDRCREIYLSDTGIVISELVRVEFISTISRKYREGILSDGIWDKLVEVFLADCENRYEVVHTSSLVHDEAFRLLYRYGKTNSLRALDALQIATLLVYRESDDDRFVCADRRLSEVLTLEEVGVLLVGIP